MPKIPITLAGAEKLRAENPTHFFADATDLPRMMAAILGER